MTTRVIPPAVLDKQIAASNPAVSAWVSANAGSGKTYVLSQRVIRLLLDNVAPEKILCITFTKAAAANMAKQVFDTLAKWIALDDTALDAAIRAISSRTPDAALRARARRLFALALETPGGLKVQTIHAFCTRILHQFPFEANVAARFDVLDEATEAKLLGDVSVRVMLEAAANPNTKLGRALSYAITMGADQTLKDAIGEAIRIRQKLHDWMQADGGIEGATAALCGVLGIDPADTMEAVEADITDGPLLPSTEWRGVAETLAPGSPNDQAQAQRLLSALAAGSSEDRTNAYIEFFTTGGGTPRKSLITGALGKKYPDLLQRLTDEQARVLALAERRKAIVCRNKTYALLALADAVIDGYKTEKDRRGLLDYDDLIDKTLALLKSVESAWVHYKLDSGIDHVLIDEAQDTSPRQWEIIHALVSEFFAGAGARPFKRTIFAVGDEKQSIFSFQGAAPREFDTQRAAFAELCRKSEQQLHFVPLRHSFRSGPNLLEAVDVVFSRPQAYGGLSADNVKTVHEALPEAAPGLVELWDTIQPDKKQEIEAWQAPFDTVTETSPQVRLAQKIARTVKVWMGQGTRPGDVLVLVRQRGPLFDEVIRALKDAQIAVAGADRLILTEHIAVMDLMVLADALLLAQDDLALATLLKSPLFGLDDDDLFAIAWNRKSSLRTALRNSNEPRFAEAARKLDRYADWARRETPFGFFARVLGPERGRAKFLSRLGPEADDAIDEFLNLALDYERRETPSLQGFIAWLRSAQTDVKRDMEIARDEVRVMTVHGAKGLEAPTVILADTTTQPSGPPGRQPRLLTLAGAEGVPNRMVWVGAKATDVAPVAAARERMLEENAKEYRRLLYVAMTRTIERLVVCGCDGARKRPEGCWYDLVADALKDRAVVEPADDGDGEVRRFRKTAIAARPKDAQKPQMAAQETPPTWLTEPAKPEPPPPELLTPSSAYDEKTVIHAATGADRAKALARGTHTHRLLQALPGIASAHRAEAARRYLARAFDLNDDERAEIAEHAIRITEDPRFYELFGPGSRAEVSIVGHVDLPDRRVAISGQIDRLVVTDAAILIADYKTNRPVPETPPQAYVAQLALYRDVLRKLYPGRLLRAALIWTYVPDLVEISAEAMDAALAALTRE